MLWKDSAVRFNAFALRESLLETRESLPVSPGLTCFEEVQVRHALADLAESSIGAVRIQGARFKELTHSIRCDGFLVPLCVASPQSSSVDVLFDELSYFWDFPLTEKFWCIAPHRCETLSIGFTGSIGLDFGDVTMY